MVARSRESKIHFCLRVLTEPYVLQQVIESLQGLNFLSSNETVIAPAHRVVTRIK